MGKLRHILFICLMFIMTSCEILFEPDNIGQPVIFGAAPGNKGIVTRTIYSGTVDGTTERIYWDIDDYVSIYMDWNDGHGYTGNPEYGLYNVSPGSYFHSNGTDYRYGRISHADGEILKWKGDFNGGNGRAHEYDHKFYSAYPPTALVNGEFIFNLPQDQSNINMNYAYMTAYEEGVKSNSSGIDGHIELHYYPMFTALFVTIDNEADFQIGNILTLSSNKAIAGSYTVDPSKRYNGIKYGDSDITTIWSEFNNGSTIMFFIIPKEYNENELSFKLGDDVKPIPVALHAGYKYNIKITTKEVEVEPGFSSFVNGVILAEAHKRRDNGQSGYDWYLDNDGDFAINGQKVPEEKIWEIINSLVDLDVTGTWQITEATADDFNIFPNIKTVKINATNLTYCEISNSNITEISIYTQPHCTIEIHDCESLTKLELKSNNGIEDVTIRNNNALEFFTIDYPHTELTVRCIGCDKLKGFSVKQNYGIRYHVEYSGCPKWEGFTMPDNSTEF